MFFSCRGVKRGQADVPPSASQRAGPGGPVQADGTSIFFGIKLMIVGVVKFSQVQKIRFIGVKIFRSYSNQFLVKFIGHVNQPLFLQKIRKIIGHSEQRFTKLLTSIFNRKNYNKKLCQKRKLCAELGESLQMCLI